MLNISNRKPSFLMITMILSSFGLIVYYVVTQRLNYEEMSGLSMETEATRNKKVTESSRSTQSDFHSNAQQHRQTNESNSKKDERPQENVVSQANEFIPGETRSTPSEGIWGNASISIAGKSIAENLSPDHHGTYPRIQLPSESEAEVTLKFDPADSPSQVVVQAQDGGHCVNSGLKIDLVSVSSRGVASFKLKMDANPGIYRFSLHHGSAIHDLDFWVGDLPAIAP